jgi:arylsulfatase
MIEHDGHVGQLLATLDDLGIADDTIVLYTTDNGPHLNTWPDAGMTPFRSEKNTNWEGAFRIPAMIRWPDRIRAGTISNEIVSGHDWFPTLLAAVGDSGVTERLKAGWRIGNRTYKVHIDGYNQLPYLTGEMQRSPRRGSSTSTTTASSWRCAPGTGSRCSASRSLRAPWASGASRSPAAACRSCSTCAWTPMSGRTSPRTPTGIGCSSAALS